MITSERRGRKVVVVAVVRIPLTAAGRRKAQIFRQANVVWGRRLRLSQSGILMQDQGIKFRQELGRRLRMSAGVVVIDGGTAEARIGMMLG